MSYTSKNYSEQGGDKWVIGGALKINEDAIVEGFPMAENQVESTATTIENLKNDFNALLTKLKVAGLMEVE
ncbi:Head fiber protein [Clostridium sp. HMP27]|uniref:Head fiber protein n=1 Tax=Clostridium sp. HMP27 TaxID=1487921 RepID=UPI00052DBBA8|nr:Head fiber protein [Clostridium sp. HMP27]KGK87364.1 Head fiber protein [Clostridium sp. HMP27]